MQNQSQKTHVLFADESGKPDLDDFTYKKFLLTGVVIPKVELTNVEGYLTFIKRKYLDEQVLKAFLDIREPTWKGNRENPIAQKAQRLSTITFASKSALSGGLELTDFISYTMFAKITRRLSKFKSFNLAKATKVIEKKPKGDTFLPIDNSLASRFL